MLIVKQSKKEEEESSQDLPRFIFTGIHSYVFGRSKQRKASAGSTYSLQKVRL